MSDKKNMDLNKFSNRELPPLKKPMADSAPQLVEEYQGLEDSKRGRVPRFRIIDKTGKSYGCSYAHLISWIYEPTSLLTLTISDKIFTLEGKNLKKIETILLEEKVKVLREFNDNKHKLPAQNEILIERIEVT